MSPALLLSPLSLRSVLLKSLSLSSGPIMQRVLSDWTTYCFSNQYHYVTACVRDCVYACKCVCACNLLSDVISICAVESGEDSRDWEIKQRERKT